MHEFLYCISYVRNNFAMQNPKQGVTDRNSQGKKIVKRSYFKKNSAL